MIRIWRLSCPSRTLSCRVRYLLFVLHLLLVARPEHRCFGLATVPDIGDSDAECRPLDIQLYTWSGPGFESGECWYRGFRYLNGARWGRKDSPDTAFCLCEHGKVRIFSSQQRPQDKPAAADAMTILRPVNSLSPTFKDLAKWPISSLANSQRRTAICTAARLDRRIRSRDGCIGCKCSKNGHWLCRKPPTMLTRNRTASGRRRPSRQQQQQQAPSTQRQAYAGSGDSFNAYLRVTSVRARPQCPLNSQPQFCILIERLLSSSMNTTARTSRYIEIPRLTSWTDPTSCTRCACVSDGRLTCEFLHATCDRPCLLHKTRPISITYYFPPGSKWVTPPNDKCRSCSCVNGHRKCLNCDQILKIDVNTNRVSNNEIDEQRAPLGAYSLSTASSTSVKKVTCILQTAVNAHRIILPGQRTWLENRCYYCSKRDGRLIAC